MRVWRATDGICVGSIRTGTIMEMSTCGYLGRKSIGVKVKGVLRRNEHQRNNATEPVWFRGVSTLRLLTATFFSRPVILVLTNLGVASRI